MEYYLERMGIGRTLNFARRRRTWILLAVLAAGALVLRCLHLLDLNHYFIVSPDSYFFHWVAQSIITGDTPPIRPGLSDAYLLHSGLSYPLAYTAKAVSSVSGLSFIEALQVTCKFLPPLMGVISLVLIFLVATKIYGRRVGLFSAFAWAIILHAMYMGAAGYLDRDGLTTLLIMIGAFLFYFSRGWHFYLGERDVGWLASGLAILFVEALLYFEWTFAGPIILLAILISYTVVQILLGYFASNSKKSGSGTANRFARATSEVNWRTFVLVIVGNIVVLAAMSSLNPQQMVSWFNFAVELIQNRGISGGVQELQGIGSRDLLIYNLLLVPVLVGLYQTLKRRDRATIFFSCWFLCIVILSLFAKRILFYAAPAVCLLAGVGLADLWHWAETHGVQLIKKFAMTALIFLLILVSVITAISLGSGGLLAPDDDWQDALAYLRDETPADAVIMTQWSWGYWILDLGQRIPVVDNGYYYYNDNELRDVGLAYLATDPADAVQLMEKYGADYLIFSNFDRDVAVTIMGWAGYGEGRQSFPVDALISRSLSGNFISEGGLEVVHRSSPDSEVVILGLNISAEP